MSRSDWLHCRWLAVSPFYGCGNLKKTATASRVKSALMRESASRSWPLNCKIAAVQKPVPREVAFCLLFLCSWCKRFYVGLNEFPSSITGSNNHDKPLLVGPSASLKQTLQILLPVILLIFIYQSCNSYLVSFILTAGKCIFPVQGLNLF